MMQRAAIGLLLAGIFVAARRAVLGDPLALAAVAGGAAGLVLLRAPRFCVSVALVLSATILPPELFAVEVLGIRSDLAELLLFGTVASWPLWSESGVRIPPTVRPLVILGVAALCGWGIGVSNNGDSAIALGQLKIYLQYLFALPLAAAFRQVPVERLERLVLRTATFGGAAMLVVIVTPLTFTWETGSNIATGTAAEVTTLGSTFVAQRLHAPVLPLAALGLLLLMSRPSRPRGTLLQIAIFVVVIGLSFDRSLWLPLMVASVFAAMKGRRPDAVRRLGSVVLVALVVPALWTLASAGSLGPTARAIPVRVASLVSPRVLTEHSYLDRERETVIAWRRISSQPILGVGLGQPTGATDIRHDGRGLAKVRPRYFLHSSPLWAWFHLGVLGLIGWFALIRVALRELRGSAAPTAVGASLAVLTFAVASVARPIMLDRSFVVATAVAVALLARSRERVDEQKREGEEGVGPRGNKAASRSRIAA